ncbi:MAG: hypothetical protein Roseis2KO_34930 [Roseivirga sp.]
MADPDRVYDLIVLGCGPGGYAAAYTASMAGIDILVITKTRQGSLHGEKITPVQSIHPGVVSLLERLELKKIVDQATRAVFSEIQSGDQVNPLGQNDETWYGHHLDRVIFDRGLTDTLNALSIPLTYESVREVLGGHDEVKVYTDKNSYRARYVIDATGYRRKSNSKLHLYNKSYSATMTCWTGRAVFSESSTQSLKTSFQSLEDGWVWIAPESENTYTWTQLSLQKKKPKEAPLPDSNIIGHPDAYNVSWRLSRPICKDNILLCGDAAGMIDPASGQGILKALLSGIKAARCVRACLHQQAMAHYHQVEYDQWFIHQFEQSVEKLSQYYQELGINHSILKNPLTKQAALP